MIVAVVPDRRARHRGERNRRATGERCRLVATTEQPLEPRPPRCPGRRRLPQALRQKIERARNLTLHALADALDVLAIERPRRERGSRPDRRRGPRGARASPSRSRRRGGRSPCPIAPLRARRSSRRRWRGRPLAPCPRSSAHRRHPRAPSCRGASALRAPVRRQELADLHVGVLADDEPPVELEDRVSVEDRSVALLGAERLRALERATGRRHRPARPFAGEALPARERAAELREELEIRHRIEKKRAPSSDSTRATIAFGSASARRSTSGSWYTDGSRPGRSTTIRATAVPGNSGVTSRTRASATPPLPPNQRRGESASTSGGPSSARSADARSASESGPRTASVATLTATARRSTCATCPIVGSSRT